MDYVIEVAQYVVDEAAELRGFRIVDQPRSLRHFSASFAPLG
jgi:tryptophanase